MSVTFAVIDASVGETPAESNLRRELDAEVVVYKASEGEFPPSVSASEWRFDGVVISGSQTSAYDDRDWIHELTEWIRRVHRADVPTLGICWGHQFLAQALDGRVVDMAEYELGYERIVRLGDDPLFEGVDPVVVSLHGDAVTDPGEGMDVIASAPHARVFGTRHRTAPLWTVQFHPELPAAHRDRLVEDFEWDSRDRSFEEVTAGRVFENFRALVRRAEA